MTFLGRYAQFGLANLFENFAFALAIVVCRLPDFRRIRPLYNLLCRTRARVIGLGKHREVGAGVRIESGFTFPKRLHLSIGTNCLIEQGVTVTGKRFEMGASTYLKPEVSIDATSSVKIGSRCCIGRRSEIYSHTHIYSSRSTDIFEAPEIDQPVTIGDNVLLYGNVVVVGGVEIGDGVVIGNRSVVTKKCEDFGVFFGVPARKVDQRV